MLRVSPAFLEVRSTTMPHFMKIVLGLLLLVPAASAQTITNWNGLTGNWADVTQWDSGVPNSPTASAQFGAGASGTYTATINGSFTVNQLTLNSTDATVALSNAGNTFTLAGASPSATLTAGTFSVSGGTVDGGQWSLNAGNFNAGGGLVKNAVFTTIGTGRVVVGSMLTTFDNVTFASSNVLDLQTNNAASLRIQNGTTFATARPS